jgi:hypothetical protein
MFGGAALLFNPLFPMRDQRQLVLLVVLPHREMLPKSFIHFRPESEIDSDENLSIAGLFCGILNPVGEAEAGAGGDQPAKE